MRGNTFCGIVGLTGSCRRSCDIALYGSEQEQRTEGRQTDFDRTVSSASTDSPEGLLVYRSAA